MTGILQKYADLRVIQDRTRTNELLTSFAGMTEGQAQEHYAGSHEVGNVFIKDSSGDIPAVLEMVVARDDQDCFATLFAPHPVFNTRDSYREARKELVTCVLDFANASILGVQVMCPLRKRRVDIRELGFKQLLELIESAVATWHAGGSNKPKTIQ